MHEYMEMRETCKERFREIDKRLDEGDKVMRHHSMDIAVVQTNMNNLVRSMNSLTKALWGVCGTTLATLLGFFVWYIQQL